MSAHSGSSENRPRLHGSISQSKRSRANLKPALSVGWRRLGSRGWTCWGQVRGSSPLWVFVFVSSRSQPSLECASRCRRRRARRPRRLRCPLRRQVLTINRSCHRRCPDPSLRTKFSFYLIGSQTSHLNRISLNTNIASSQSTCNSRGAGTGTGAGERH